MQKMALTTEVFASNPIKKVGRFLRGEDGMRMGPAKYRTQFGKIPRNKVGRRGTRVQKFERGTRQKMMLLMDGITLKTRSAWNQVETDVD